MTKEEVIRIAIGLRTDFKCESDTMVDFCNTVIKALEQEPCGDLINRQDTLDAIIKRLCIKDESYLLESERVIYQQILAMPSVTPNRRKGHWIEGKYKDTCDKCRCTYPKNIGFKNYCPNCGARMVGV